MGTPKKISLDEAWNTTTIFFVDETLEDEIDQRVNEIVEMAERYGFQEQSVPSSPQLAALMHENPDFLDLVLLEVGFSTEKFQRVVTLLRRLGRIEDKKAIWQPEWAIYTVEREWSIEKIKNRLKSDAGFAQVLAETLLHGKEDPELQRFIPRYYLEMLDLANLLASPPVARRVRYKRALIGTYSGRKGYYVERRIAGYLDQLRAHHGIGYEQGRSRFTEVNLDFAIPSLDDPWVIIMSSFQETTSSGQSTKARDMLQAYDSIRHQNTRYRENRAFVNFVDGGGWLARRADFERLWEHCDYFINLAHLDQLEAILLAHVPQK